MVVFLFFLVFYAKENGAGSNSREIPWTLLWRRLLRTSVCKLLTHIWSFHPYTRPHTDLSLQLSPLQTQKVSSSLSYDIHYWIGSESSQDEQGAAAVYTIQLDEFLGCAPVQHREVQNHESDAFRGYFKQGIMWEKVLTKRAFKKTVIKNKC